MKKSREGGGGRKRKRRRWRRRRRRKEEASRSHQRPTKSSLSFQTRAIGRGRCSRVIRPRLDRVNTLIDFKDEVRRVETGWRKRGKKMKKRKCRSGGRKGIIVSRGKNWRIESGGKKLVRGMKDFVLNYRYYYGCERWKFGQAKIIFGVWIPLEKKKKRKKFTIFLIDNR